MKNPCKTGRMTRKSVYLLLAALGVVVPYFHFVTWLTAHGFDLPMFLQDLHANGVSEFFAADVVVSALVVIVFLILERGRLGSRWWLPVVALLLCGVSAALPLLLYLREGQREQAATAPAG
jgi:Terpene cyclase DEP1